MSFSPRRQSRTFMDTDRSEIMSEVREQLAMPGMVMESALHCGDDYIEMEQRSNGSSRRSRTVPNVESKSPRTPREYWARSNSAKVYNDHGSVHSGASSLGWRSFRSSKSSRHANNQIVADFFDVQSLASAPAAGAGARRKPPSRYSSNNIETQSVVSKKSVGGFISFFLRHKGVVNDEVESTYGLEDFSQYYGGEPSIDDEELTLGSGLHSAGDLTYDDDIDELSISQQMNGNEGSRASKPKKMSLLGRILNRRKELKAKRTARKQAKESEKTTKYNNGSMRNRRQNPDFDETKSLSNPRSHWDGRPKPPTERTMSSLSVSTSPPVLKNSSNNGAYESDDKNGGIRKASSCRLSRETVDGADRPSMGKSTSCRWSRDSSVESGSSAPRPPVRRRDSNFALKDGMNGYQQNESSEHSVRSMPNLTAPKVPQRRESVKPNGELNIDLKDNLNIQDKDWRENVRRKMAKRTGKDFPESKDDYESYHDDSDESVLSLLSGLLATWSAERGGIKIVSTHGENLSNSFASLKPKRSILKTSVACIDARPRYSVVFDTIVIREYERTVGDNPSCSRGPPISIGWSYVLAHEYPIDDYELLIKAPKRSKKEFHLSADIRTHLLMEEWECSEEEIRKARREVTYIQYCRAKSSFAGVRSAAKEALFLRKGGTPVNNTALSMKGPSKRTTNKFDPHNMSRSRSMHEMPIAIPSLPSTPRHNHSILG